MMTETTKATPGEMVTSPDDDLHMQVIQYTTTAALGAAELGIPCAQMERIFRAVYETRERPLMDRAAALLCDAEASGELAQVYALAARRMDAAGAGKVR